MLAAGPSLILIPRAVAPAATETGSSARPDSSPRFAARFQVRG